uniref:Uncharacterized protein n=1 Tax=Schistosoma haematobium TaxID=6185 RepID=A0A094ZXX0_SCHHA
MTVDKSKYLYSNGSITNFTFSVHNGKDQNGTESSASLGVN